MSIQIENYDTTRINAPIWKTILDGVMIGKLFSYKWKGFSIFRTSIASFKYATSDQTLQTLKETQIRFYEDNTIIVGKKICVFYQIYLPYLANLTDDQQQTQLVKYADFIENIKTVGNLEIFYYDREEKITDYNYYLEQLKEKQQTFKFFNDNGEELSNRLIDELPDTLNEIMQANKTRIREAFVVISEDILGSDIKSPMVAKIKLNSKVNKLLTSFKELSLDFIEVEGEQRDWLLTNFVSNVIRY